MLTLEDRVAKGKTVSEWTNPGAADNRDGERLEAGRLFKTGAKWGLRNEPGRS